MNSFKKCIWLLAVIVFLVSGCKSSRKAADVSAEAINIKSLTKNIENSAYDFKYVSAKARVNFQDGSINQGFTANIRMKKGETIWMSLTGPFGIEGGRVLITPDKIQIIDRINRVYYNKPFNYIYNYIPFQVDIKMLQDIILANPLQTNFPKQEVETDDNKYLVKGGFNRIDALYFILPGNYKYHRVEMQEPYFSRKLMMDFSDYRQVEGEEFPFVRKLDFSDKENKILIDLNFSKVKKESELDFPFAVPDNFKVSE
jgi:hypothetical protein